MKKILEKNVVATCNLQGWNTAVIVYHIKHRVGQCVAYYQHGDIHILPKSKYGSYVSITINTSAFQYAEDAITFYWHMDIKDQLVIIPDLSDPSNPYAIKELYRVL